MNDTKFRILVSLINLLSTNAKPAWNFVASTIPIIMLMSENILTKNPLLYPKYARKMIITNIITSSVFNIFRN